MTSTTTQDHAVTGVILAGGRARRMGGNDKGLIQLADKTMVEHVIQALRPQVVDILINANRNCDRYAAFGFTVVKDSLADYCGPLAGMASAMQAAETPYIVTAPCDSPFVPADLVKRLAIARAGDDAEIAVAQDEHRMQPVFALLRCNLLPSLLDFLHTGGRKIDAWYAQHHFTTADFSDQPQTFVNINTPQEMQAAQKTLGHSAL